MEENASGVSKGRSIADGLSGAEIEPEEIITGRIINHLNQQFICAVDQFYMMFILSENLNLPRNICERSIKFKAFIN